MVLRYSFSALVSAIALLTLLQGSLHAERYQWIGGTTVGLWDDAANWTLEGGIPGPGDEAAIAAGHVVVSDSQVSFLILDGRLAGGKLSVSDFSFIRNSTLAASHKLTLNPLSVTSFDGLNPNRIIEGSQVINNGTIDVFDVGEVHFETGSTFVNQSVGGPNDAPARFVINLSPEFITNVDYRIAETSGTGSRFINKGGHVINRSPGGVTTVDVPFDNEGLLSAEKGSFVLKKGGTHRVSQFLTTGTNEVIFAGGTNRFRLQDGNIEFARNVIWEEGEFALESRPGLLKTELFRIKNSSPRMRGTGRMESAGLQWRPQTAGSVFPIDPGLQLTITRNLVIDGPKSTLSNSGTIKLQGAVVLNQEAQLQNTSLGELRFQSDVTQDIRSDGSDVAFVNDGLATFHNDETNIRVPFQSESGKLQTFSGKVGFGSRTTFSRRIRLGRGATIGAMTRVELEPPAGEEILLEGVFDGPGTVDILGNPLQIAGKAFWRGPDLYIKNAHTIHFKTDGSVHWVFDSVSETDWRIGSSSCTLMGPGVVENRSSGIKLDGFLDLQDIDFINDGPLDYSQEPSSGSSLDLVNSSFINHDTAVFGSGIESFTLFLTGTRSRFGNQKAGLIRFESSKETKLRPGFSNTAVKGSGRFDTTGEIHLTHSKATLSIFDLKGSLNGLIRLNEGTIEIEVCDLEFGPNIQFTNVGETPSQLIIDGSKLAINGSLTFPGTIEVQSDFLRLASINIPITGTLRGKEITFPANPVFAKVQVSAPVTFSPGLHLNKAFLIMEAEKITGITPSHFDLSTLPGGAANYVVDITEKKVLVTVLSAPDTGGRGIGESKTFDDWVDEFFEKDEPQTGMHQDPDGDGRSNLNEYATGTNPSTPDPSGVEIELIEENGNPVIRVRIPKSSTATGVQLEFKQGPSLEGPFEPIDPEEIFRDLEGPGNESPPQEAFQMILPADTDARFIRMEFHPITVP